MVGKKVIEINTLQNKKIAIKVTQKSLTDFTVWDCMLSMSVHTNMLFSF